jgi:hypothetical protein
MVTTALGAAIYPNMPSVKPSAAQASLEHLPFPLQRVLNEDGKEVTAHKGVQRALRRASYVAASAVVATLAACDSMGTSTKHWTEDVTLDDGPTLAVERAVKYTESSAWGGGAYNATELSSTISFSGAQASMPTWSAPLEPMVLYRDATRNGQWVIVATTSTCAVWSDRGEPRPPYWEFRLGAKGWQEAPLSTSSHDRPTNLYLNYTLLDELYDPHHVPAGEAWATVEHAEDEYRYVRPNAKWNCPPTMRGTKSPSANERGSNTK